MSTRVSVTGARKPRDRLVIIALSGGVDSAVAAWRLLEEGWQVQGLHMTNWEDDEAYCTAAEDLRAARRVADQLGIPLHLVNFSSAYRARVFQAFLDEYAAGRTPNPDVLCNREIKFGECLSHARRLGAEFLATGHYARVLRDDRGVRLALATDQDKDQTYFLHAVPQAALAHALFPLGDLSKAEVRALAREIGLANWDRPDSTGICFIGERPFQEFLGTHLAARPGPIEDEHGTVLGEHRGLMFYTIGQRGGLGLGGRAGASEAPWYVAAKRLVDNTLVVVQGAGHPWLFRAGLVADTLHWIGAPPKTSGHAVDLPLQARIRHRQGLQSVSVTLEAGGTRARVAFAEPQRGVAPGQYVVFYDGDDCLGGGVIRESLTCVPTADSLQATLTC
ncbi:MAG: tRNA 2-thiouridine(34) synthase MnmA [Gammaproteobacteria bacterium]|nr:MAG: tRNA 2-thiouridine(34) synthase MnmA [Gammaproteobacteria bacterium]